MQQPHNKITALFFDAGGEPQKENALTQLQGLIGPKRKAQ